MTDAVTPTERAEIVRQLRHAYGRGTIGADNENYQTSVVLSLLRRAADALEALIPIAPPDAGLRERIGDVAFNVIFQQVGDELERGASIKLSDAVADAILSDLAAQGLRVVPGTLLDNAVKVLKAYELFEADIIVNGDWGPSGLNPFPRYTQALYDRWLEIQAMRNEALGVGAKPGADIKVAVSQQCRDEIEEMDRQFKAANRFADDPALAVGAAPKGEKK